MSFIPSPVEIRIRWKKNGGHYHCRLFTRKPPGETFAKCGSLVFDEYEWESVRDILSKVEFKEEGEL